MSPSPVAGRLSRAPWFHGPRRPPRQTLFIEMIRDARAARRVGRSIACDVGAAQRGLGNALAVALDEGMRRDIAWLVERWRPSGGGKWPDP